MMAKWGSAGHPHRVGGELPQCLSSHFAEVKTPGSFWLKVWFHCTHAKEGKSQHLLLKDPRGAGTQWAGGRAVLSRGMNKQETEQGSKHQLLIRRSGQRSLTFFRLNSWVVILKGPPAKAKQELEAEILSSGPYLNVQTLGVNRVVIL